MGGANFAQNQASKGRTAYKAWLFKRYNPTTMALIKWEPFGEIDRFFEDLPSAVFPKMGWDLAVDIYEKDGNLMAEMNLPGVDPDKIDVSVEGGRLHISGSREESKEEKQKQYYSREIRRGSFERVVRLPSAVQEDKVKAEYRNGELLVTMPKAPEAAKNKVPVEVKE